MRRYYIPSTQHGGGSGGFDVNLVDAPACPGPNFGRGIFAANPVPHTETVNALRFHFRNWVMKDTPPPPSRYPTLGAGHPGRSDEGRDGIPERFPACLTGAPTGLINPMLDYDWGPDFNYVDGSGVPSKMPPAIKHVIG